MNKLITDDFVFVGNRRFVLEIMLAKNIKPIITLVAAGTRLEKEIDSMGIPYTVFRTKEELLQILAEVKFDVLISNGCPYILPISEMKTAKYVNIHPSFLPDLKGIDPAIGAILFERDAGATCHIMDSTIDGGDIISQVKIPYSVDLDVLLCYYLGFEAEKEVFLEALDRRFIPTHKQILTGDEIYYSRSIEDRRIHKGLKVNEIIQRCKAFSNRSQGALIEIEGKEYKLHGAKVIKNSYAKYVTRNKKCGHVLFQYEANLIFRHKGELIKVASVTENFSTIKVGAKIF